MEIIAIFLIVGVAVYGIINIGAVIWIAKDYSRHSVVNKSYGTHSTSDSKTINLEERDDAVITHTYLLQETDRSDNVWSENNKQMIEQQRIALENTQHCSEEMVQQGIHDLEEGRLAATGYEFGGYNSDPNLNPMLQQTITEISNESYFDSTNDNFANDTGWCDSGWNSGSDFSNFDSFGMF